MKEILILCDYKGNFGSKWNAIPYRSGLNKQLLTNLFTNEGFNVTYQNINEINYKKISSNKIILYTSSEDKGYQYKSYIQDVIFSLSLRELQLLPDFKYLMANNNKVAMELIRKNCESNLLKTIKSYEFGCLEEYLSFYKENNELKFPIVIKEAEGAMSKGVFLAKNNKDLIKKIKKITFTKGIIYKIKDYLRTRKHENYIKDSIYRKKFILQEFIPNLNFDLKVLIFGKRVYICKRPTKENDFRASGSGASRYNFGSDVEIPVGLFEYIEIIKRNFETPNISVDIAFDGKAFHLIEFQAIYFGTSIVNKSDGYYIKEGNKWIFESKKLELEKVYVDSIVEYLNK